MSSFFHLFIQSHGTESTYETKERKYAIIQAITAHSGFELLGETFVNKFTALKVQGPHFLPSEMRELKTVD